MRPERAKYELDISIQHALRGDSAKLNACLPHVNKLLSREDPYETEYETFGEPESVLNELMYISDRFRCYHRLMWLKTGIERDQFQSLGSYYDYQFRTNE